ncbi:MAG TPA: tetratricopeptide repeat protein [Bacteroidia bacterium]
MRFILFCLLTLSFVFAQGQESDTTWFKKGNRAFYKVNLGKAIDCYSKAIELNPKYNNAYYNRGLVKADWQIIYDGK